MVVREPQSANDYDDRTTEAVKSVLIEIGQILGSFAGKFAVVGGAVPWLLLREADTPHIGTRDIDLSLDAEGLADGEYVGPRRCPSGAGLPTAERSASLSASVASRK